MIEITPPMSKNMNTNWEEVTSNEYSHIKSKETIAELSSSLSEFKVRSVVIRCSLGNR